MFTQLVPILKSFASVNLILSAEGDNCRLIVIPKAKDEKDPIQPFTVSGTAAELDATLPELLSGKYVPSMQHTGNNFHLIKQLEEESRKKLEEKAKAKPKTGIAAPRPPSTVAPATAPVKPVSSTPDLFGGEEKPDHVEPELEEETETDNEEVA
jgi:PRTRC genetic system protein E